MKSYEIVKLPDGGFVVTDPGRQGDGFGYVRQPLFAATKIGDALEYIREKLTEAASPRPS